MREITERKQAEQRIRQQLEHMDLLDRITGLIAERLDVRSIFQVLVRTLEDSLSIVQTIISLTHALSRKVVAEGVETREQTWLLQMLHCDQYQGYLFSRPLPGEEITALLVSSPPPSR